MASEEGPTHQELIADLVDEPQDDSLVDMLSALPPELAEIFSLESRAIDYEGKSQAVAAELQSRFGFVGGVGRSVRQVFQPKASGKHVGGLSKQRMPRQSLGSQPFQRRTTCYEKS